MGGWVGGWVGMRVHVMVSVCLRGGASGCKKVEIRLVMRHSSSGKYTEKDSAIISAQVLANAALHLGSTLEGRYSIDPSFLLLLFKAVLSCMVQINIPQLHLKPMLSNAVRRPTPTASSQSRTPLSTTQP